MNAKIAAKLETAKALLANADDESLTAEARLSYQTTAYRIIAKFGLEEAIAASKAEIKPEATKQQFIIEGVYHQRRSYLLDHIAKALGCQVVLVVTRGRQKLSNVWVYGMPTDLMRVTVLWSALDNDMLKEMEKAQTADKKLPKWQQTHGRTLAANFIVAYANKVHERLEAAERSALDEEEEFGDGSYALVLWDNEKKVLDLYKNENPGVRTSRLRTRGSGGLVEGRQAGERVNLGLGSSNLGGSGRKALN